MLLIITLSAFSSSIYFSLIQFAKWYQSIINLCQIPIFWWTLFCWHIFIVTIEGTKQNFLRLIFWNLGNCPESQCRALENQHRCSIVTPHVCRSQGSLLNPIGSYPEWGITCFVALHILHTHISLPRSLRCVWICIHGTPALHPAAQYQAAT